MNMDPVLQLIEAAIVIERTDTSMSSKTRADITPERPSKYASRAPCTTHGAKRRLGQDFAFEEPPSNVIEVQAEELLTGARLADYYKKDALIISFDCSHHILFKESKHPRTSGTFVLPGNKVFVVKNMFAQAEYAETLKQAWLKKADQTQQ